ncbi:MAG TPA: PRC-barrel domain-containing protein, partial [Actinomycetota bacterium]
MTLPTIDQARSWRGLTLVATDDEPVGKIEAIYVDRTSRQPEWALVNTGLFGSSRTFVPLADAAQRGDTVQVPHETSVVREAPRLEQDAELSEEDEARLYAHYGIQYTTEESASGLPAGETASAGGGAAPASDATSELPSSRLEADPPAVAGVAPGTSQTATPAAGTSWSGGATGTSAGDADRTGRGKQAAAAGFGAVVLAAVAAGLAALRRRRRQPPSIGERVGQAGREAADALAKAADEVRRQAMAATSGEGARKAAKGGKRAARKTARKTDRAG